MTKWSFILDIVLKALYYVPIVIAIAFRDFGGILQIRVTKKSVLDGVAIEIREKQTAKKPASPLP